MMGDSIQSRHHRHWWSLCFMVFNIRLAVLVQGQDCTAPVDPNPGTPTLDLPNWQHDMNGSYTFEAGEEAELVCTGPIGETGAIEILLLNPSYPDGLIAFGCDVPPTTCEAPKNVTSNNVCRLTREIRANLVMTSQYNDAMFACVTQRTADRALLCQQNDTFCHVQPHDIFVKDAPQEGGEGGGHGGRRKKPSEEAEDNTFLIIVIAGSVAATLIIVIITVIVTKMIKRRRENQKKASSMAKQHPDIEVSESEEDVPPAAPGEEPRLSKGSKGSKGSKASKGSKGSKGSGVKGPDTGEAPAPGAAEPPAAPH